MREGRAKFPFVSVSSCVQRFGDIVAIPILSALHHHCVQI
jgi:hypothetical protein